MQTMIIGTEGSEPNDEILQATVPLTQHKLTCTSLRNFHKFHPGSLRNLAKTTNKTL